MTSNNSNLVFKVTVLFKGECLKKVHYRDKVTTGHVTAKN